MQLLAHITQPPRQHLLHEHVDIFALHVDGQLAAFKVCKNFFQTGDQLVSILSCNDTLLRQHGGMSHRSTDVLRVHSAIKTDGRIEIIRDFFHLAVGSAGPHLSHNGSP